MALGSALESSARGIRVVWISLAALGVTAVVRLLVAAVSGSVALRADTLHSLLDVLTAVPLLAAFVLGRRTPTRRYTHGYGRAEDLAGLFIVVMIALAAFFAVENAIDRFLHPAQVEGLGWVAIAGLVGFLGNEAVAAYRIRAGRGIGSAALVADGHHARTDGLSSLAVLLSAGALALGWNWADPAAALLISVAILLVLVGAARDVGRRIMDAVDPDLIGAAEAALIQVPGVLAVDDVRMRWVGHGIHAEAVVYLDPAVSLGAAEAVVSDAERHLAQAIPQLTRALVRARARVLAKR